MNVKKEVIDSIKKKLSSEQDSLRSEIRMNKYNMKQLALKQEIAKRSLAKLQVLIRELEE